MCILSRKGTIKDRAGLASGRRLRNSVYLAVQSPQGTHYLKYCLSDEQHVVLEKFLHLLQKIGDCFGPPEAVTFAFI